MPIHIPLNEVENYSYERYKGFLIKYWYDLHAESPRKYERFGKMICFHRRYRYLGDPHYLSVKEAITLSKRKDIISLPLYLYDHSGLAMNTTGFPCHWDSGQIGYIFIFKKTARKELKVSRITKKLEETIKQQLKKEVEIYNQFLSGDIWCFEITHEEKPEESIDYTCGIYGLGYCLETAKKTIDHYLSSN